MDIADNSLAAGGITRAQFLEAFQHALADRRWPVIVVMASALVTLAAARSTATDIVGLPASYAIGTAMLAAGLGWYAWPGDLRTRSVGLIVFNIGLYVLVSGTSLTVTYLFARLGLPFQDADMAGADAALGFSAVAYRDWIESNRFFAGLLTLSYLSFNVQLIGSCVTAAFSADRNRTTELFMLMLGGVVFSSAISGLVPALGTHEWFRGGHSAWTHDIELLRHPGPVRFHLKEMLGIVTFPSVHAMMAVLFVYAHRGSRLFYPVLGLNLLMLLSTPAYGSHYLVDVIAGLLIAALAIAVSRHVRRLPAAADGHA